MKNFTLPSIKLLNGHKAPFAFYKAVEQVASEGVEAMSANRCYTARELCGEDFWSNLPSKWWRWLAGRCFAHMIYSKKLKVKFHQYKKSVTKHYVK